MSQEIYPWRKFEAATHACAPSARSAPRLFSPLRNSFPGVLHLRDDLWRTSCLPPDDLPRPRCHPDSALSHTPQKFNPFQPINSYAAAFPFPLAASSAFRLYCIGCGNGGSLRSAATTAFFFRFLLPFWTPPACPRGRGGLARRGALLCCGGAPVVAYLIRPAPGARRTARSGRGPLRRSAVCRASADS